MRLGLTQGVLEIRQFLRSREQVMFTLAFPAILILVFGSIFSGEIGDGVKFTQYFVTAIIATGLMTAGFQALAIQIPMERDRGVLKRLRGTPMPRWVYFAGKVVLVVVIGVAETVLLLAVATVLFDLALPRDTGRWLTFGWVAALGVAACTLCGIAFSSLARTARSGTAVVTPVALVLQDVTEARRVEAVRRDFVANVGHELKTPVGALSLLAEAIEDAADDPETVRRFAGRMTH